MRFGIVFNIVCVLKTKFKKKEKRTSYKLKKYKLAFNERFIREWTTHHLLLGFHKIMYLFFIPIVVLALQYSGLYICN